MKQEKTDNLIEGTYLNEIIKREADKIIPDYKDEKVLKKIEEEYKNKW